MSTCILSNEPAHDIMVRFVLRKLILQTHMRSHPVGLDVFLVGPFDHFHTSYVRTAKALERLRGCTGSPELSLVAFVVSAVISMSWFKYTPYLFHWWTVIMSTTQRKLFTTYCIKPLFGSFSLYSIFLYVSRNMTKQRNKCAPSEDSNQPGHPPSLIRVFAVLSMGS